MQKASRQMQVSATVKPLTSISKGRTQWNMVFRKLLVISNDFHIFFIFGYEKYYFQPRIIENRFFQIPLYIEQEYWSLYQLYIRI